MALDKDLILLNEEANIVGIEEKGYLVQFRDGFLPMFSRKNQNHYSLFTSDAHKDFERYVDDSMQKVYMSWVRPNNAFGDLRIGTDLDVYIGCSRTNNSIIPVRIMGIKANGEKYYCICGDESSSFMASVSEPVLRAARDWYNMPN